MRHDESAIQEIKVGDTVCMRDGGVPMTVLSVYTKDGVPTADTEFWDGEKDQRASYPCDALLLREPSAEDH